METEGLDPIAHRFIWGRDIAGRRHEIIDKLCKRGANKEVHDNHTFPVRLAASGEFGSQRQAAMPFAVDCNVRLAASG
jgi:hypothetical protein